MDQQILTILLSEIRTCPDRGNVLPHSQQPECGCAELTDCRVNGPVTLSQCLRCQRQAFGLA